MCNDFPANGMTITVLGFVLCKLVNPSGLPFPSCCHRHGLALHLPHRHEPHQEGLSVLFPFSVGWSHGRPALFALVVTFAHNHSILCQLCYLRLGVLSHLAFSLFDLG